jgi:hypothetical protein
MSLGLKPGLFCGDVECGYGHPASKSKPPNGVTKATALIEVRASIYKLPLNKIIPPVNKEEATIMPAPGSFCMSNPKASNASV